RIIHALHLGANRRVLRLLRRDIHRRADSHERKKLRRGLAFQPDATVCARRGMDKPLVKSVTRSELAPVTHRVTNVMTSGMPGCGRHNAISLYAKAVRAGTSMLDFAVDTEVPARCALLPCADRAGYRHQATVALHHINVLLRERNFHAHSRRIMRAISRHVVWSARTHPPSGCTTS